MIFSDANPVQFWCAGYDTFNETEPEGVFRKCFCQPYECEDEITIQFRDTTGQTLSIYFITEDDEILYSSSISEVSSGYYQHSIIPLDQGICEEDFQIKIFDSSGFGEKITDPNFDSGTGWSNQVSGFTDWAVSGGKAQVTLNGTGATSGRNSNAFTASFSDTNGSSIISVEGTATRSGSPPITATLNIYFYSGGVINSDLTQSISIDVGTGIGSSPPSIQNISVNFFTDDSIDEVRFEVINTTSSLAGTLLFEMDSFSVIESPSNSFLAQSDCISVKENQKETVLINYTNNRIFTGLSSAVGTPDPEFNLRIPGCFYHERFPTESEAIELSSGRNIQLNAQLTAQKLLEIGLVPYYMHKKIKLALMFQTVTIDGEERVMTEAYEILQTNRRSALKQAKVWLTEKDSTVRNIL